MKKTRRKRRQEREKLARICDAAVKKIGRLWAGHILGRPCIVCGQPGTGIGDGFVYCQPHWNEAFAAKVNAE